MRQSWDSFFYELAGKISERSTCLRRQYGCVLVRDKTVISTGFNGAPRGCAHCEDAGCARNTMASGHRPDLCRGTHAEQNAIAEAARVGACTKDTELYLYPGDLPCPICAKIIINAGITVVHYRTTNYPGWELSRELFVEAGVTLMAHFVTEESVEDEEEVIDDREGNDDYRKEDTLEQEEMGRFRLYP